MPTLAERIAPHRHLLGVHPDRHVARLIGASRSHVSEYRRQEGIPNIHGGFGHRGIIDGVEAAMIEGGVQGVKDVLARLGQQDTLKARARVRAVLAHLVKKKRVLRVSRGVFAPAPRPPPRSQPIRHVQDAPEPARAVPFALRAYL